MIRRTVIFSPEAQADLMRVYDWIAEAASPEIALSYIERVEKYVNGLGVASERGSRRDEVRPGLRIVGFERRVTIAFQVAEAQVTILRVFYGGRDWPAEFGKP